MTTVAELTIEEEIKPLKHIALRRGWHLELFTAVTFEIGLPARDGTRFWLYCDCERYPSVPPAWHWYNAESKAVDQLKDIPCGGAFFHNSGVICAPWNRLAYRSEDARGPHSDWTIGDWRSNPYTGGCRNLAAMALRIAVELKAATYKGRTG